jgi:hypothetical protein
MVYVNELGRLLLEQGWSEAEVVELGYGKSEEEGDEYYQDESFPTTLVPTYPVAESSTEEILVTEMMRVCMGECNERQSAGFGSNQ